jgi:hypothetical protein
MRTFVEQKGRNNACATPEIIRHSDDHQEALELADADLLSK